MSVIRRGRRALPGLALLLGLAGCAGTADADRDGTSVPEGVVAATLPDRPPGPPVSVLAGGLAHSMDAAARGLREGRRARAMRAADEAARVGEVALFAAGGRAQHDVARAVAAVREARRSVQTGRPDQAGERLAEGARWLRSRATATVDPSGDGRPPWHLVEDDERYYGARLINARGAVLGEVVGFVRDGDRIDRLVIADGWRDFLGFWDISGRRLTVPASRVVFGPARTVGTTIIALTSAVSPRELRRP